MEKEIVITAICPECHGTGNATHAEEKNGAYMCVVDGLCELCLGSGGVRAKVIGPNNAFSARFPV